MSLKDLAQQMKATGRKGDTELVHMTKREVAGLQALAEAAGGKLTTNPKTGLPEASFLERLLPTILGAAANFFLPGSGIAVGALTGAAQAKKNDQNPLLGAVSGGFGAAGGSNVVGALSNAGTTAAQAAAVPAAEAAGRAATEQAARDLATRQAMAEGAKVSGAEAAQMAVQGQTMPAIDLTAPNMDAIRNQAMGDFYRTATPQGVGAVGQGIQALASDTGRDAFMQSIGGTKGLMRSGIMAAAPGAYGYLMPREIAQVEEKDEDKDDVDLMGRYKYESGYTGGTLEPGSAFTGERRFFRPRFIGAAQGGAVKKFADGGEAAAPSSEAVADPARGMTGMSRDAMLYLSGLNPTSRTQAPAAQPMTASAEPAAVAPSDQLYVYDAATNSVVRNPNYVDPKVIAAMRERNSILGGMNPYEYFLTGGENSGAGGSFSGRGMGLDDAAFGVLGYSQGPFGMFSPLGQLAGRAAGDYLDARADYIGGTDFGTLGAAQSGNIAYGGIGTFSDQYGNVGTYSSPSSIAAYDASWSGGSGDYGGGYGGTNGMAGDPSGMGPAGGSAFAAAGGEIHSDGIAALARGGMKAGGFVVPADVVSMVGEGNTDAGYDRIKRMIPGATPIKGKDGGQADTVKTSIEGKQPARIAHGEVYVPPAAVKRAGGAKKLYAMMKNVRQQATGRKAQIKPVNLKKAMA
jgi:hypothetical protein